MATTPPVAHEKTTPLEVCCPFCKTQLHPEAVVCQACNASRFRECALERLPAMVAFIWLAILFTIGVWLTGLAMYMWKALEDDLSFCFRLTDFLPDRLFSYCTYFAGFIPFGFVTQALGMAFIVLVLGTLYLRFAYRTTFGGIKIVWKR